MDTTLIPTLDGIKPRPFASGDDAINVINKVSLAIFLYILLVMYPAYGFLRSFWVPEISIIDLKGSMTALMVATLFALFARRSAKSRVTSQVEAENQ